MQVLCIQLNACNEKLVSNVGIACLIKCTQWNIVLWCGYCIFNYMHTMNHGFVMHVLHLQLYGDNERLIHDVNIAYSVKSHSERCFYDANIALLSFLPQNCYWKCTHICISFILNANYTSTTANVTKS
jgi:hypothetical protein